MIYRLFGALFFAAALGLGFFAARDYLKPDPWTSANPAKKIRMLVEKDIRGLSKEEDLPPEWSKVSKTSYRFESSVTKVLMAEERPNFNSPKVRTASAKVKDTAKKDTDTGALKTETDKEYELEIDVIDVPDENEPGFIFQMSLFESSSKNKIYEVGRTYHWSSLNEARLQ